jgi:hypothetical protein
VNRSSIAQQALIEAQWASVEAAPAPAPAFGFFSIISGV